MNEGEIIIGAGCPKCRFYAGLSVSAGSQTMCPECKVPLVPTIKGPETHVIANSTCAKCGAKTGLHISVGSPAKCSSCGEIL